MYIYIYIYNLIFLRSLSETDNLYCSRYCSIFSAKLLIYSNEMISKKKKKKKKYMIAQVSRSIFNILLVLSLSEYFHAFRYF